MSTTTPTKTTVGGTLLAHTQQATAVITVGSAVDVSTIFALAILVRMGRTVTTALTNNVRFRLEGSFAASANDLWETIWEWTSASGATAASKTTLNDASCNAGDTVFTLTSGTGFTAGDRIYLRETGTPGNSEWVREKSVSTNDITIEEALTRNHTNGIDVTDLAEAWNFVVDVSAYKRVRLVVDTASAASGQTVDVLGLYNSLDSLTTA